MLILQGYSLTTKDTIDELTCWSLCRSTEECSSFSYGIHDKTCQLFKICAQVDSNDWKFVSGHKECFIEKTG